MKHGAGAASIRCQRPLTQRRVLQNWQMSVQLPQTTPSSVQAALSVAPTQAGLIPVVPALPVSAPAPPVPVVPATPVVPPLPPPAAPPLPPLLPAAPPLPCPMLPPTPSSLVVPLLHAANSVARPARITTFRMRPQLARDVPPRTFGLTAPDDAGGHD